MFDWVCTFNCICIHMHNTGKQSYADGMSVNMWKNAWNYDSSQICNVWLDVWEREVCMKFMHISYLSSNCLKDLIKFWICAGLLDVLLNFYTANKFEQSYSRMKSVCVLWSSTCGTCKVSQYLQTYILPPKNIFLKWSHVALMSCTLFTSFDNNIRELII